MLSHARLLELISYDPLTGAWGRRVSLSRRTKVGAFEPYIDKSHGYAYFGVDGKTYYAHHLAWFYVTGEWPKRLDHRNTNRADNRFSNLRPATQQQNNKNVSKRADTTSPHKGVTWHRGAQKWMAQIASEGRRYYLGLHASEDDAHAAYSRKSSELHGEFGNTKARKS